MHTHAHHHPHTPDYGRAFAIGIFLNVAFIAAEVAFGLLADSLALLADAGHNASDVLALILAWIAARLARRAPAGRFTYGLQSASILAALANALLLLVAVGGIVWEALQRLSQPEAPAATTVIVVALIGTVINGATAWLFRGGHTHDLNIRGAYLHMAADAAISLGVAVAAALMLVTGWLWLDPVVSLVIALAIVVGTWRLLTESLTLALHAVPKDIDMEQVRRWLAAQPGVAAVHDLHIWAMSTTGIALSAHLVTPEGHPGDAFLHRITQELAQRFQIGHVTLQIEIGDSNEACTANCVPHPHAH